MTSASPLTREASETAFQAFSQTRHFGEVCLGEAGEKTNSDGVQKHVRIGRCLNERPDRLEQHKVRRKLIVLPSDDLGRGVVDFHSQAPLLSDNRSVRAAAGCASPLPVPGGAAPFTGGSDAGR